MKNKFEIPELVIILFEGDLATDGDVVASSGSYGDPDFGDGQDEWGY